MDTNGHEWVGGSHETHERHERILSIFCKNWHVPRQKLPDWHDLHAAVQFILLVPVDQKKAFDAELIPCFQKRGNLPHQGIRGVQAPADLDEAAPAVLSV